MQCAPPPPKTPAELLRSRATAAPPDATLSEVFAETAVDGAATGFVLAHVRPGKPVLWVQDRLSRRECGVPYLAGFARQVEVLRLDVSRPVDVLWALEQGLGCPSLGAVVGEVWGDPPALDFTATKRLALRSEAHAVPCWLLRRAAQPALSAARERWRLGSLPSASDPHDARAPGMAHWRAELFRSRFRPPTTWVARYDRARHHMALEHPMALRTAAPEAAEAAVAPGAATG
ncbi:hypothetical protein OG2516_00284 [Oceanicola granulosus HTCC2516]|uniref:Protein ImuA n=1 Tax=Oceanicola granulosus (strain ATCC BAA-861 / DSM 15982 / KCTC 12143 / HTCC2516) TaxID=314256 RepID=Q2C9Z8_OCEGH|nr:hypothetical protein [Oceanicola granulosus]EAR49487.1 hypothetical protein OG2516_00284 [Oceanicola granulosus HTCC2516]